MCTQYHSKKKILKLTRKRKEENSKGKRENSIELYKRRKNMGSHAKISSYTSYPLFLQYTCPQQPNLISYPHNGLISTVHVNGPDLSPLLTFFFLSPYLYGLPFSNFTFEKSKSFLFWGNCSSLSRHSSTIFEEEVLENSKLTQGLVWFFRALSFPLLLLLLLRFDLALLCNFVGLFFFCRWTSDLVGGSV